LNLNHTWPRVSRGVLVCAVVAAAATFLSRQFGGPQLLYALLLGMSLHFLAADSRMMPGLDFCSRTVLRLGVALLGARITVEQAAVLGWVTLGFIVLAVILTIACGVMLAYWLGWRRDIGLLSGGAVAICGVSAALAIAAALPPTRDNQRLTLLAVVGVTVLSTVAMVLYPFALQTLAVAPSEAGIFLGGTIHDVAQVVAAGTLIGPEAADAATLVKLCRVLLLMPVVVAVAWLVRCGQPSVDGEGPARSRGPAVPGFLWAFAGLMTMGSLGWISAPWVEGATSLSRWALVLAIAAAGVKTSLGELACLGWRPAMLLLGETLFLALLLAVYIAIGQF
jgi:uncharacterized integral membrane protein (TIGR00698 family)